MGKLADSESEKGFIGTDCITTPIRKPKHRDLHISEKKCNALTAWRILFTGSRRPLETFLVPVKAAIGLYFFKLSFAWPPGRVLWLGPRSAER
jgi:hypothetical protein